MIINKRKIINDPVYGFIPITNDLIFDIIEHPYFQRLRRINQLGLTFLVYPGALHTRFHHALGTMYLMGQAIETLRYKGFCIDEKESTSALISILLHDIGHGPFSHNLEHSIVYGINHEELSEIFFERLNVEFDGNLTIAKEIFNNSYHKKLLHKLVSSQLDMDRLDYLKRDSFFTGVSEGVISTDRIIKMLNFFGDELVVESKGIYSIEKFIVARRLMYWQVYFHKTVLSAEYLLLKILQRAKYLVENKKEIFATPAFKFFLENNFNKEDFINDKTLIDRFSELDDYDILASIKVWTRNDDKVLSLLSKNLIFRRLYKTEMQNIPFDDNYINRLKQDVIKKLNILEDEVDYFVFTDTIKNNAYDPANDKIFILYNNNIIKDISEASDQLNVEVLSKTVIKHFLCYPKHL